jgi:hypothetical protein
MANAIGSERGQTRAWGREIGLGAVAGVAGGLVFGAMMAMQGMMPMIAGLVGSQNGGVGFVVHLVISAAIGAIYGAAVGNQPGARQYGTAWLYGLGNGFVWWILGPLVIMPLLMGMGLQFGAALSPMMLMSLVGHLIYGVVTALAAVLLLQRI